MRGCGDYNNHHTIYTWMAEFIICSQTEMSQYGVSWKLSSLAAVDQQHCSEESCHPENGTCIVLVLPLSSQPPPPHTYRLIFNMSTTSSNAYQVRNHWYGSSLESAIKVVLYAVENINPAMCVGAV